MSEKKSLTRSISLPVQECLSHSWSDFMKLLHACWRQSTDLANWASQTCARNDVSRTPGMTQLPRYSALDLYALAFGREKEKRGRTADKVLPVVAPQYDGGDFWSGGKIAAATLLRNVQTKYAKERGKIVWRRERRTPEYLYPYPFPVHQQSWTPTIIEQGRPVVTLSLPGGRVSLRLRNGSEFAPQMRVFRLLESGDVARQQLSLCRQSTSSGNHARQVKEKTNSYRVMVRIAYRMEANDVSNEETTATVKTGRDPFLSLLVPGNNQLWVLHAGQVHNWIVEHGQFLQDFADDLKFEKRWPGQKRKRLNRYRERRCEKHARRMKTFLQTTAAQVVGHAKRRGCGRLVYDDSDRTFVSSFPWFALANQLSDKCDQEGLVFDHDASGDEENGDVVADNGTTTEQGTV